MEILKVPQGEFELARYPHREKETLRAWDAADEYLLNYFYEEYENTVQDNKLKILLINDSFGALTTALAKQHKLTVWNDSWLSQKAIQSNCIHNGVTIENIEIKNSIETPVDDYDFVLIKTPKSHAMLEDQLARIKPFLTQKTHVIAAGMAKSIHTSTLKLFECYIGSTKTSLAKKKARLIFSQVDKNIPDKKSPYPKNYVLENTRYKIINHANVFSRESLDVGTRFFLQHIPQSNEYKKIIDLACGNGVVGLIAVEKNPNADILFLDESYMAVASAQENMNLNMENCALVQFEVNDCLSGVKENSVDLILNNPPFHQNNVIGDEVAWKMFKQSKQVLKKNGELWVIGNRHLGYHVKLKRIFNSCEVIITNKKFVILRATKK